MTLMAAFTCVFSPSGVEAQTQSSLSIDVKVSKDNSSPSTTISTAAFSSTTSKELLLAFISSDAANSTPHTSVTGVSGGGLTWELVQRTNVQLGTAEIWRAFALTKLSTVKVTATLSESVDSSMTVVSFVGADLSGINGSGAIGAVRAGNSPGGAPTSSLVTTRNNSWVFGVGNDWDKAINRTPGPNQSIVHQYLAPVNDTYWVQSQNAVTQQAGTTVVINDTAPTTDRYNLSLVEVLPAQNPPPNGPLNVDTQVSSDKSTASTTNATPAFSTSAANALLLAFVSADSKTSPNTTVTGISGGGLTWQLVQRTNVQSGTAEIWRAFATAQLSNVSVTVTLSQSVASSVTVVGFLGADPSGTNGSGAIGAVGTGNGSSGAPTASLVTRRNYSWLFGVGNDWDYAISRTLGANQSLVHQYLATVNDTYWVQAERSPTQQSGTTVVVNDTAPTGDRYNLSIVEVLPAASSPPLQITASASPAPNTNGWNNRNVTVTFQCVGGVAPVQCPAQQTVSTEGANQSITGTATDANGNTSTTSVQVSISILPPIITLTATPSPNVGGWSKTPVTVSFSCSASVAPITSCPNPQTKSQQGTGQAVSGTVTDAAGNTATTGVTLNLDLTPPTVTISLSPPPQNGINTTSVTVSFSCSDALSGIASCPAPIFVGTPGANQVVSAAGVDNAGNSTTASVTLNVENALPRIIAIATPSPNASDWNNSAVTVSFQCSGGVAPLQCPAAKSVSADGAKQTISGTVTDAVGHSATASVAVSLDQTPPLINVTSPLSGSYVNTGVVTIQGLVSDALSGAVGASCNGAPATFSGAAFACNVALIQGGNSIAISATDRAGNTATSSVTLTLVTPMTVQITTPSALQLFSTNRITVTGTVSDPTATVTVGAVPATSNGGSFTASGVILREGKNLLTASASNTAGGVGSDTVAVYLDTTPPVIHIDNPSSGAVVTSSQIDVTGNVNDMVTGTVNGDQVSVTVNGVNATVANRSFAAHGVLLVPGTNTITAVATDRAGNTSQHQGQVTLQQLAGQTLSIVSGNSQSAAISSILPQPMVVLASDALGRPMANVALNFAVTKSDGLILAGQQKGRQLTIQTGVNGQASVQFELGSRNGAGANQVSVSAPGFVGQAVFSADSNTGTPAQINTVSGETQVGAVGMALAEPMIAIVFDAGGNPVSGVPVTFQVKSGGGLVAGQTSFIQNTDSDGKAYTTLVLGLQEGINNNSVTASFAGMGGQAAVFTASGVVPGPLANTTVSGMVLDNAEQPIPNATAIIKNTNLSARTNAQGQFTISNAPVGDIVLYIDGSTSTSTYTFPTLSFQMATIPGINNSLGHPVYLPPIDTNNSQVVGGDQPVQLTMTGIPGLVYTVAPNSVTFPDGTHVGRLTLSQVHGDRVPMTPPNGTAPRLVGTLQPAGVLFNPPIQIQLPNTDGLAPGQVEEIFSFHHDVEQFVVEGTARVSEDGSVVVSDPGFGLTVSGWHGGGGQPQPPTCGDACSNGCYQDAGCSDGQCTGAPTTIDGVNTLADGSDPDYTAFQKAGTQVSLTADPASNCKNLQYDWDFGDGSPHSSTQNPTHSYTTPGSYEATVTVTCADCAGVSFSSTVTANVMQLQIQSPCTDNPTLCAISSTPSMPVITGITPQVLGLDESLDSIQFQWRSHIEHDAQDCRYGPNSSYAAPDLTATITGTQQFLPNFSGNYGQNKFGGDFTLFLKANIHGVDLSIDTTQQPNNDDEHVRGTNPNPGSLWCELPHDVMRKIACQESKWIQFNADATGVPNACPNWSSDSQGGAGVLQVTPVDSYSGAQDLWDWTTNVADGVGIFNAKKSLSNPYGPDSYPTIISQTGVFQSAFTQLNIVRKANQLKPVTPYVPPFTRGAAGGDWSSAWGSSDKTGHQFERDVIQAYNGYCDSTSQYGTQWHQYQLQTVGNGNQENPPQITVNENTLVGAVSWVWIPNGNRPDTCGTRQYRTDTAYVDKVLNQDPTCGTGVNSCQ